jgi:hypothetical protein
VHRLVPALFAAFAFSLPALGHADFWEYRTSADQMTSKENRFASVMSDNALVLPFPYNSKFNLGGLTVRGAGSSTDVFVSI